MKVCLYGARKVAASSTHTQKHLSEKSKILAVMSADLDWDDVGNHMALHRLCKDETTNSGKAHYFESSNCAVRTQKPVMVVGCENISLVETDNVLMMLNMRYTANLKDYVARMPLSLQ